MRAAAAFLAIGRTQIRKQMNKIENESASKAMDSLINFETVKFYNNELYETQQYDKYLRDYDQASLKTQVRHTIDRCVINHIH